MHHCTEFLNLLENFPPHKLTFWQQPSWFFPWKTRVLSVCFLTRPYCYTEILLIGGITEKRQLIPKINLKIKPTIAHALVTLITETTCNYRLESGVAQQQHYTAHTHKLITIERKFPFTMCGTRYVFLILFYRVCIGGKRNRYMV